MVNPIVLDKKYETNLQDNLLLVFSGLSRKADIVARQISKIDLNKKNMKKFMILLMKQKTY